MLTKIKSKNTGFTLLEVIVAIFILTVGIGGSFSLIQQTISTASMIQSRLIAAYLGQEGIEIVRNIRDNNWLKQRESLQSPPLPVWNDGMSGCQGPTNCCEGDYKTKVPPSKTPLTSLVGCDFNSLNYLKIDDDGFYSYLPGTPTKFKRKILIDPIEDNKMKVVVIIQWKEKNKIHEVEIVEHITNWYEEHRQ